MPWISCLAAAEARGYFDIDPRSSQCKQFTGEKEALVARVRKGAGKTTLADTFFLRRSTWGGHDLPAYIKLALKSSGINILIKFFILHIIEVGKSLLFLL